MAKISIHAPARGGDKDYSSTIKSNTNFNPRPREGGRQKFRKTFRKFCYISIHAPARGGDMPPAAITTVLPAFQSTPPRGGATRRRCWRRSSHGAFQSTPPRGGATALVLVVDVHAVISIHAPARGGDSKDAQFYLRIFDKQVELLRFWGKMRGGCLRNPEKDRRFLGKSLANLPEISGHLDFAGA